MAPDEATADDTHASVNRRQVLRAVGMTAAGGALLTGQASATKDCVDCVFLGNVEGQPAAADTYEFTGDYGTITIEVKDVTREDGPDERVRSADTELTALYPCAPGHSRNPNREFYAISNVSFYRCLSENRDENGGRRNSNDGDDTTRRGPPDHARNRGRHRGRGR